MSDATSHRAAILRELDALYEDKRKAAEAATSNAQRTLNAWYLCGLGDAILAIKAMPDE